MSNLAMSKLRRFLGIGSTTARPVLATVRLMPEASLGLTVGLGALIAVSAILPPLVALASGNLVGSIPAAVGSGLDSPAGERLVEAVAIVVGLFALQQIAGPGVGVVSLALGRRVNGLLRVKVMDATLGPAGIAHLEDPAVLDKITLAQGVGTGQVTPREAVAALASLANNRLRAVASAVLLAYFNPLLAVGVIAVYAVMARLMYLDIEGSVRGLMGQAHEFRRTGYFRDLALTPEAAKELRVFGLFGFVRAAFQEEWRVAMADVWRSRRAGRFLGPILAVSMFVVEFGAFGLVAVAAARGEIDIGALATYAGAIAGVSAYTNFSGEAFQIGMGTAAVPAALELAVAVEQPRYRAGGTGSAAGLPRNSIRFEGVTFGYAGRDDYVYENLDLEIRAGQSLAIVGQNGAGKTTLVKLLTRLHEPTAGRITVDGIDLATLDPREWQRRVAAIFQDFARFQLSARDNVGFGALDLAGDDLALDAATARAGGAEVVAGLAGGWDTVLSRQFSGGTDLSGGQWQRMALARALFAVDAGAGVLVLDEPTAALDVRAEAAVYDRFLDLTAGLTTLVISHRFSTVRQAERIVVIEHGQVIEDGDHASLLAAGGRYATMFNLQASSYVEEVVEHA